MAYSDEINSCSFNTGAGQRTRSRPQSFCDAVQMDSTLEVAAETSLSSTLTVGADAAFATNVGVTGIVTAGEVSTLVLTLGGAIPPPPGTSTFKRASRSASRSSTSAPSGNLSVAGELHVGGEFKVGSGYYASFKKDPLMSEVTEYVLPPSYPTVSGQVLSSSTTGEMEWVAGGGGGSGFNQDYGFVSDPAPIGYDFGFI